MSLRKRASHIDHSSSNSSNSSHGVVVVTASSAGGVGVGGGGGGGKARVASSPTQLSMLEALRVTAILQETLEKLSFLGSVTPDISQHREELSQIVGDEISKIISDQKMLEERYEDLVAKRGALKVRKCNCTFSCVKV